MREPFSELENVAITEHWDAVDAVGYSPKQRQSKFVNYRKDNHKVLKHPLAKMLISIV